MMRIEITIPVLNEEGSINEKIRELDNYIEVNLRDLGEIKIIIADNGSTDGTILKAQALERELERVEYLRLEQRGVGLALKASWTKSCADIVGYMDLDLATDLKHVRPALNKLINLEAEIVTGSRLKSGAKVIGRSRLRNVTSFAFNKIVKSVFAASFSDGMCGFKFLQRRILDKLILNGAKSDGWFFATEILVVSEFLKYRIYDLPVIWTDDPNSKVKIIKLAIEYIKQIMSLKKTLNKIRVNCEID
jgi:glycosyltransferase involved in cell wall biosynthesis